MTPLPKTPADCQAPFTSPVARAHYDHDDGEFWRGDEYLEDKYARRYALAQQAEFEHLWLRELHGLTIDYTACDGSKGIWDALEFGLTRKALSEALETLTPYLTPNTHDHE